MIPKQIDTHMKDSLGEAIGILFPLAHDPENIISRHNWRTREVLGEVDGATVIWRGWSARVAKLNSAYRTLYIDYVPNILPVNERYNLFGAQFADAISELDSFVTMFVTSFRHHHKPLINSSGFICRVIGPNLHACKIIDLNAFISQSAMFWAGYMAKLANLQIVTQEVAIDRKANFQKNIKLQAVQSDLDWEDENRLLDI